MEQKTKENEAETEEEKPVARKPKIPARQIPKIVTKDTNDIDDIPLELSREFSEPEGYNADGFTRAYPAPDEYSRSYSRSRTLESTVLHRDRFKSPRRKVPSVTVSLDTAERFEPDFDRGLTASQVEDRFTNGYVNATRKKTSRTYRSILFAHIVTPINIIAVIVALAIIFIREDFSLLVRDLPKLFFIVIILINMGIGIFQEVRAKRTIEKLSLLTAPTAIVIRNGEKTVIPIEEVVLDDVMFLEAGKQICADAIVLKGEAEVNESLLTGESVPMKKQPGTELYSGSFVASGNCYARVNKVGASNYVETLISHAKKYRKPKSELYNSVGLLINIIIPIAVIITMGTLLFYYFRMTEVSASGAPLYPDLTWRDNIQRASAVMIGMLPMGMFLLISTALFASVVRLGKRKAVAKDLNSIEMLARVDVLCLDKTGTITDGTMTVKEVVEIKGAENEYPLEEIIGSILTATGDNNQTAMALANRFGYSKTLLPSAALPFSSVRKFAAVTFGEAGTYVYGAPEFVLKEIGVRIERLINEYAAQGFRVLVLAHSPGALNGDRLPAVRRPLCLLVIEDHIRPDAMDTIAWFRENQVAVKVISGDNPITVSEVAKRVGVEKAELYISLDGLSNQEVIEAANAYTVFGRVTPEQKMLLIKALKQKGRTVAMTGDGVNDILAMRESDCAVAIASGAEAARNVAHIVLQDSNFSSMPQVVLEGRRVVNNIEQSSSLFLMKTFMTMLLSVISLLMQMDYPYTTDNLLLLELCVIAAASFALALQTNKSLITGKFLSNVIGRSAPGGITLTVSMMAIYFYKQYLMMSAAYSTLLVLGLTFTGFIILVKICEPTNLYRNVLLVVIGVLLVVGVFILPTLFSGSELFGINLADMAAQDWIFLIVTVMGSYFFVSILIRILRALKFLNY